MAEATLTVTPDDGLDGGTTLRRVVLTTGCGVAMGALVSAPRVRWMAATLLRDHTRRYQCACCADLLHRYGHEEPTT
jgi:hypothetical protein